MAQYPFIDRERCIGCGTCVTVCPEGDVLGIVGGVAVVINGLRCVGHALCEEACPVGSIEVGLGDLESRSDIPQLDEHHETNVPGLFIAGELGGLSLIRNAIEQGERAVEHIAERIHRRPRGVSRELLDLVIVGAGPAGLSAALAARRHGLSHLVLEKEDGFGGTLLHYPRRKLVLTRPVELPLAGRLRRSEYTKEELLELLTETVERFEVPLRFGERVVDIRRGGAGSGLGDGFIVTATSGRFLSRFVLLALGRRGTPRKLGVRGEELSKVMYQLRDAESYRGERVLVVGGGDSAVEAAMGLAHQPGTTVALSYRKPRFFRIKKKNQERLEKLVAAGKILPLTSSEVLEIEPRRVRLRVEGGEVSLSNDYVFVFIGGEPPFPLLERAGVGWGDAGGRRTVVPKNGKENPHENRPVDRECAHSDAGGGGRRLHRPRTSPR
jgi:thioredoxin reductase